MNWRSVARSFGAFILFLVLSMLIGSIVGVLLVYLIAGKIFSVPPEGSTLDMILDLGGAVLAGFFGVTLGSYAFNAITKNYPARGIGVAYIVWLVANYALHFIFFPELTDYEVYHGLVQSAVACGAAWFVFRLPPLTPRQSKANSKNTTRPFHANTTREERQDWFAHTSPWDQIAPAVINAILDGITDKTLLEVFVLTSMENGLVAKYEPLGRDDFGSDPTIIRAQVSQILCQRGNPAIISLTQALEAKQMGAAKKALMLAVNTFEPAIALAKNQIVAYAGMSAVCGLVGKRAECHDWAKRGLVELAEMRRENIPFHKSAVLPADMLDQMERQLRSLLE